MSKTPIILFILSVLTGICYFGQTRPLLKTEGFYPVVRAAKDASYQFSTDTVEITLQQNASLERIAVFAYDREQRQVVVVKPLRDGKKITVRRGDFADYRVTLDKDTAASFEIFREIPGVRKGVDFFELLVEARAASRRYGLQDCLYPICTLCMDVCPVIKHGVIKMKRDEYGAFYPAIYLTGCPRCGKCFAVCKLGAIVSVRDAMKEKVPARPAAKMENK